MPLLHGALHQNKYVTCLDAQPVHFRGMHVREITLPVDDQGRSILPSDAANLPILLLIEALIAAGWSDRQVRRALRGIISDQDHERDDVSGSVIELVRRMT